MLDFGGGVQRWVVTLGSRVQGVVLIPRIPPITLHRTAGVSDYGTECRGGVEACEVMTAELTA
eukprot:751353-Hanusia_phi.AAC.1